MKLLRQRYFDAVVSDIEIGAVDGWRLARLVRAGIFNTPDTAAFVLLCSTWCERIAETTARAYDIDQVLPMQDAGQLPELLTNLCKRKSRQSTRLPILVVEDDQDIAELAVRILGKRHDVAVATTGREGIERFVEQEYAIVLLDVMLPELSGQDVLDRMMAIKPMQTVVAMTAHGGPEVAEQMMLRGAADFITKPFRAEQLRRVIDVAAQREDFMISNRQFAAKVKAVQDSEQRYRKLSVRHERVLNHLSTVVMELDNQGVITFVNRAWSSYTGANPSNSLGRPFLDFVSPHDTELLGSVKQVIQSLQEGHCSFGSQEFMLRYRDNDTRWVFGQFNLMTNEQGQVTGQTLTLDNIDERKQAEQRLKHLATHDTLTELYNRYYFDQQLKRLAQTAHQDGTHHALLYIDLDHFKVINDSQGHTQGDAVLRQVAERLSSCKREQDILSRVGGDEFALLLPDTSVDTAVTMGSELCRQLELEHYRLSDRVYKISASIGVAMIDGTAESAQSYLQQADIALYVAKGRGRSLLHVYSADDRDSEEFRSSVEWAQLLQEAIVNDQIVLHFQPVMHSDTLDVAYYEALVRLQLGDELVMPGTFIPALERVEDMSLLDHQVVSRAIHMMSKHPLLERVAINLSAQAFGDVRLLPLIQEKLEKYQVAANRIIFELTESASLSNLSATRQMIDDINILGCAFSIDDFGTGFSTFSYLKTIPAQSIKIDGSFVRDMAKDPMDRALVRSISEVARALNKTSVAEFVEDAQTLELLRELGVDYVQGYYLGRPTDIHSLEQQHKSGKPTS